MPKIINQLDPGFEDIFCSALTERHVVATQADRVAASILENIRLGTKATTSDILHLADDLGFSTLPMMTDLTRVIMDSSNNLSGGELIVIQLLRSILRRPKYLILDEIFAAITPRYHDKMAEGIVRHCSGSIFINHLYPQSLSYGLKLILSQGELINDDN